MPPNHPWPTTQVGTVTDTVHGQRITDPYRWLEDEQAPAVQAWMTEQDGYARARLAKSPHHDELADYLDELASRARGGVWIRQPMTRPLSAMTATASTEVASSASM